MRETGEVRFRFTGDETQCQRYIALARTLLGQLKHTALVPYAMRTLQLQDGVTIRLTANSGLDTIEIDVPESSQAQASGITIDAVAVTAAGPVVDVRSVSTPLFGIRKGAPFLPTAAMYKPKIAETVLSLHSPQQRNIVLGGSGVSVAILHTGLRTADSTDVTGVYGSTMRSAFVTTAIQFIGGAAWFKYATFGWVQAAISDMYSDRVSTTVTPANQITATSFGPLGTQYQWNVNVVVQGRSIAVTVIRTTAGVLGFGATTVNGFSVNSVSGTATIGVDGSITLVMNYYETFQGNRFAFGTAVKDWEALVLAALGTGITLSGSLYTKTVVTSAQAFGSVTFFNGVSNVTLSVEYPECDDVFTWHVLPALQDVVFTSDAATPVYVIQRQLSRTTLTGHIGSGSLGHGTDAHAEQTNYYQADMYEFRRDGTLVAVPPSVTTQQILPSGGGNSFNAAARTQDVRYGKNTKVPDTATRLFYSSNYDTTLFEQHFTYPAYEIVVMPAQVSDPGGKRRYQVRVRGVSVLEGFRAYTETQDEPGSGVTHGTAGYYKDDTNQPFIYDSPVNGFVIGGGDEIINYGLSASHVTLNDQAFDSNQVYKQSVSAYFGSIFTATQLNLLTRTTLPGQSVAIVPPEFPAGLMYAIFKGTASFSVATLSATFGTGGTSATTEFPALASTIASRVAAAQAILAAPGVTLASAFKPLMTLYTPFVAFISNGLSFTPSTVLLLGAGDYLWINRG